MWMGTMRLGIRAGCPERILTVKVAPYGIQGVVTEFWLLCGAPYGIQGVVRNSGFLRRALPNSGWAPLWFTEFHVLWAGSYGILDGVKTHLMELGGVGVCPLMECHVEYREIHYCGVYF